MTIYAPRGDWWYKYSIPDLGETIDDARVFSTFWAHWNRFVEVRWVAQKAAAHYCDYYEGGDASWPLTLELWTEGGMSLGLFTVARESVPRFVAKHVSEKLEAAK